MPANTAEEEDDDDQMSPEQEAAIEECARRWRDEAPAIMQDSYRLFTGLKPPQAWSFRVEKQIPKLVAMQLADGDTRVVEFLRESVVGWAMRCGGGLGVQPGSPFFADSMLFSPGSLEWNERNRHRVRRHSILAQDPSAFPQLVHDDVLAGELDYWLGMPNTVAPMDITRPGVYWILFSAYFQRLDRGEGGEGGVPLDRMWHHWDHRVDCMGRTVPAREAFLTERERLRADRSLFAAAAAVAVEAINEAAMAVWSRLGIGIAVNDSSGHQVLGPKDADLPQRLFDGEQSLWEWEIGWRAYLSGRLGLEFDEDSFRHLARSLGKPTRRRGQGSVEVVGGQVSSFMAGVLADPAVVAKEIVHEED